MARGYAEGVSPDSSPVADLARLLAAAFSADELRRFVRELAEGEALARELPEGAVSPTQMGDEVAGLLHRHHRTQDERLWRALFKARPAFGPQIVALRGRLNAVAEDFPGYIDLKQVGRGGSGIVYEVIDRSAGVKRAIKLADPLRGPAGRERLEREYRLLAGVEHPALLRVYHLVLEPHRAWMVCEHLGGGSLQERIQRREPWPDLKLARLGAELAGALAALHRLNPPVLHLDLKPENILFDDQDRPRLIDLGHAQEEIHAYRTGAPVHPYLAPELLLPEPPPPNPRMDQYSLCKILLRLALPEPIGEWPERPEEVRARLSGRDPALVEILIQGRARSPGDRFPDTAALEAAWKRILEANEDRRRQEAERRRVEERKRLETTLAEVEKRLVLTSGELERQREARDKTASVAREAEARARRAEEAQARVGEARARERAAKARTRLGRLGLVMVGAMIGVGGVLLDAGISRLAERSRIVIEGDLKRPAVPASLQEPIGAVGSSPIGAPTGRSRIVTIGLWTEFRFLELSAGEFDMGSTNGKGTDYERPLHRVRLTGPIWLAQSEVTQGQWRAVVWEARAAKDTEAAGLNWATSAFTEDDLPVEAVSWCDVVRFANALSRLEGLEPAYIVGADCEQGGAVSWSRGASGYRLPTEAEWEYAARAGQATVYGTGNTEADLGRAGWYDGNSAGRTHAVCTAAEQPWGLCDLHGNVWEWVWDGFGPYDPASEVRDPVGVPSASYHVFRGGSSTNTAERARAASRARTLPSGQLEHLGFRLVLPAAVPVPPGGSGPTQNFTPTPPSTTSGS